MGARGPLRPRGLLAGLLAAGVSAALAACATPPVEVVRPPLEVEASARHDLGSATSEADVAASASPAPASWDLDPDLALRVTCRFVRLDAVPEDQLQPLAACARLLLGATPAEPLAATPRLLRGARVALGPDPAALSLVDALVAARPAPDLEAEVEDEGHVEGPTSAEHGAALAAVEGALPEGSTVALTLRGRGGAVRVRIHRLADPRAGGALDAAVELELKDGPDGAVQRERAVLAGPTPGARLALVVVVPSPFVAAESDRAREAVVFVVEVRPAPAPGDPEREAHRLAVAACAGDLARARAVAASLARPERPAAPAAPAATGAGTSRAIEALAAPADQRLALLGLSMETGAGLALDLATSGPDALVAAVASRALGAVREVGDPRGAALGLCLERAAVVELAQAAEADDADDVAVHGMLLRAVGGLALRPSTLLAAAEAATEPAAWQEVLRAENLALLEDGDAATRVRAAEWLAGRGALPAGFDPLGPAIARRSALAGHGHGAGSPAPGGP